MAGRKKAQNVLRSIKRGYQPVAQKSGAPTKTILKKQMRTRKKP